MEGAKIFRRKLVEQTFVGGQLFVWLKTELDPVPDFVLNISVLAVIELGHACLGMLKVVPNRLQEINSVLQCNIHCIQFGHPRFVG